MKFVNSFSVFLKLEPHRELYLPLAEERAVRSRGLSKGGIKRQRGPGQILKGGVDACDLSAIEEVKSFTQHFNLRFFTYAETARKSQIEVLNRGLLKETSREQRKSTRPSRTIKTASGRKAALSRRWVTSRRANTNAGDTVRSKTGSGCAYGTGNVTCVALS